MNLARLAVGSLTLGCALAASGDARAESIAGVCPDGSIFVVAERANVPCARARFVAPSDLPPIKPQYLPRPYLQSVDEALRDERNPYNLIERAERIRALRAGEAMREPASPLPGGGPTAAGTPTAAALGALAPRAEANSAAAGGAPAQPLPGLALTEQELADLVQVIVLRQSLAPATLTVRDLSGRPELELRYAYSPAFERRVRDALSAETAQRRPRVLAFSARSVRETELYPRFLVSQEGATFRPEPGDTTQLGLLLGAAGPMPAGTLVVGYLVLPPRFDPGVPLDLWWNDRRVTATLLPDAEAP
jgi:hypothetical protein